jgi:hypothetical protein
MYDMNKDWEHVKKKRKEKRKKRREEENRKLGQRDMERNGH